MTKICAWRDGIWGVGKLGRIQKQAVRRDRMLGVEYSYHNRAVLPSMQSNTKTPLLHFFLDFLLIFQINASTFFNSITLFSNTNTITWLALLNAVDYSFTAELTLLFPQMHFYQEQHKPYTLSLSRTTVNSYLHLLLTFYSQISIFLVFRLGNYLHFNISIIKEFLKFQFYFISSFRSHKNAILSLITFRSS